MGVVLQGPATGIVSTYDSQGRLISKSVVEIEDITVSHWAFEVYSDCDHEWKKYVGLVESYEYCTKCDEKRR